jgi:hypothetical protein
MPSGRSSRTCACMTGQQGTGGIEHAISRRLARTGLLLGAFVALVVVAVVAAGWDDAVAAARALGPERMAALCALAAAHYLLRAWRWHLIVQAAGLGTQVVAERAPLLRRVRLDCHARSCGRTCSSAVASARDQAGVRPRPADCARGPGDRACSDRAGDRACVVGCGAWVGRGVVAGCGCVSAGLGGVPPAASGRRDRGDLAYGGAQTITTVRSSAAGCPAVGTIHADACPCPDDGDWCCRVGTGGSGILALARLAGGHCVSCGCGRDLSCGCAFRRLVRTARRTRRDRSNGGCLAAAARGRPGDRDPCHGHHPDCHLVVCCGHRSLRIPGGRKPFDSGPSLIGA